ncbi:hypothetical protein LTR62_007193 [Meristemomyces frigidus]|uniref:Uncharacterized protein n=1 Tax=Meristemomyces frigidus TaxID=1508187 RepID=A0AAN7YDU6_9PEZI|nr:hypothetical protein LTR62_007193 [Meristemomyces frigidus]
MTFIDVVKALFAPALIAAALYGTLVYIILPLHRRHRERYSQYLPLNTLSTSTTTFRQRLWDGVVRLLLPRSLRWRREATDARYQAEEVDEQWVLGEEEGEAMVGFGNDVEGFAERGRDGRGGRVVIGSGMGGGGMVGREEVGRASVELERGFRDDSSEEEAGGLGR